LETSNQARFTEGMDFSRIFTYILKYWWLFVVVLFISLAYGYFKLRYSTPVYQLNTTLLIKDDKKSGRSADDFLQGMELVKVNKNIQNEIQQINALSLCKKTVSDLHLDVSYFAEGTLKHGELYNETSYIVEVDSNFHQSFGTPFYIHFYNDSVFSIYKKIANRLGIEKVVYLVNKGKFNVPCISDEFYITIRPRQDVVKKYTGNETYFILNSIENVAIQYRNKMAVDLVTKNATIVSISSSGTIPEREVDFLNQHAYNYVNTGLEDKNKIAQTTISFIENYLLQISDSLKGADRELLSFKSKENILDIANTSSIIATKIAELENQQAELLVKDKYYKYLLTYIEKNYDIKNITAPSIVGIADPLLNNLVQEIYKLYEQQGALGFSAKEKNPSYQLLELKISNAKKTLIENLSSVIYTSSISLKDIANRLRELKNQSSAIPRKESLLLNLQRQYNLNEGIYTYLMERKIEAGIARSSNVADNKVIEPANAKFAIKISPQESKMYLMHFLVGLIIPFSFVMFKTLRDKSIHSLSELKSMIKRPIIGVIGHYLGNNLIPVIDTPKSVFAEAIRSIRISMQYIAADKACKVIGVTSSISGEGKTFISINLAASLAQTGKKVLLIGADLRKPRLHEYLNISNNKGLSTLLIHSTNFQESIVKKFYENLDVLMAGPVPPNPTQLLESKEFQALIHEQKKNYDFIILDGSPLGLVTDYFLKTHLIDFSLFVVRQGISHRGFIQNLEDEILRKNLNDFYILYNDEVKKGLGYGYGYGYGYNSGGYLDEDRKLSFMQKMKNKIPFINTFLK
jgi:tyrosine-protein kinase Etk/Wzc